MTIYVFEGKGHWLKSVVVVTANTKEDALEMAKKELTEWGLRKEEHDTLELKSEYRIDARRIVYADCGDY